MNFKAVAKGRFVRDAITGASLRIGSVGPEIEVLGVTVEGLTKDIFRFSIQSIWYPQEERQSRFSDR